MGDKKLADVDSISGVMAEIKVTTKAWEVQKIYNPDGTVREEKPVLVDIVNFGKKLVSLEDFKVALEKVK